MGLLSAGGAAENAHVTLAVTETGAAPGERAGPEPSEPRLTGTSLGQGLATVHGFVRQCGGHLCVHGEPGCGTTFAIYLPGADTPVRSVDSRKTR